MNQENPNDKRWMGLALDLAKKGAGHVNPNPMVGAVIVRNNILIASGWHEAFGRPHAEINALEKLQGRPDNCTLYVNLEPCSHYGKTPPCTDRIIESGIKQVVIAMKDPNPLVNGRGIIKLKDAGINIKTGILESRAKELNKFFIKHVSKKIPYVIMKTAMSLDGKIAAKTGVSKWITSKTSRACVHTLRNRVSGVMVGINTVLQDNPMLNARHFDSTRSPIIRIVADSNCRIPVDSALVRSAHDFPLTVFVSESADRVKCCRLVKKGVQIIRVPKNNDGLDLEKIMIELGKQDINSILLEGGGTLCWNMLKGNLIDEINAFIAPKLIGGRNAKTPIEGEGFGLIEDAVSISEWSFTPLGNDLLIKGRLSRSACF